MTTPPRPDAARNASPYLYGTELEALGRVLADGQYGHTAVTEQFEQEVARFLGVPDAVATASGTAALHCALLAAGVGAGDEVIVPSMTFCATVQAIRAVDAVPRFVEVNPNTLCVESATVMAAVTDRTRAVLPVLYGGRAVDLGAAYDTLHERGIAVIEDAAHAFGSHLNHRRVGATGALTCFSFGPIKNLTCGQGGMVIPRNPGEADFLRGARMLGVVQSQAERQAITSYRVEGFGLRYQMSSINAAIGLAQLDRFAEAELTRRELWVAYRDALRGIPAVELVDVDVTRTVPHLCVVRVPHREDVFRLMKSQGIAVGVHYPPNHLQAAFKPWHRRLPITEKVSEEILSLPFHQHLTETDIDRVVNALEQALTSAGADRTPTSQA